MTTVEFFSDAFPPYPTESEEVNPGRWGKRLAEYLQRGLAQKGIQVGSPRAEDWGWELHVQSPDMEAFIGCANLDETPQGFLCSIEAKRTGWRKWFAKVDPDKLKTLTETLDKVLRENPQIRAIEWAAEAGR